MLLTDSTGSSGIVLAAFGFARPLPLTPRPLVVVGGVGMKSPVVSCALGPFRMRSLFLDFTPVIFGLSVLSTMLLACCGVAGKFLNGALVPLATVWSVGLPMPVFVFRVGLKVVNEGAGAGARGCRVAGFEALCRASSARITAGGLVTVDWVVLGADGRGLLGANG